MRRSRMMVAALAAVGLLLGCEEPKTPLPQAAQDATERQFHTALGGALTLQRQMRDPRSLEMEQVIVMPSDEVCYRFRSRNGLGGMAASAAVLAHGQAAILLPQARSFRAVWETVCSQQGQDLTDHINLALQEYAKLH